MEYVVIACVCWLCCRNSDKGSDEKLQLYELISNGQWDEVLRHVRESPETVTAMYHGPNIIEHLIRCNGPTNIVQELLGIFPEAAKFVHPGNGNDDYDDPAGQTLLHVAVCDMEWANIETIKVLLQANPAAITVKKAKDRNYTPLHLAIGQRLSIDIIKILLSEEIIGRPRKLSLLLEKDEYGNLPLHTAISTKTYVDDEELPWDTVHLLLEQSPNEAVECINGKGETVLHLAVGSGAPWEPTIKKLLQMWPGAAKIQDEEGSLPLHKADESDSEALNALLEAYPDGAKVKDNDGKYPLHNAIYGETPLENLKILIKAYPEAAGPPLAAAVVLGYGLEKILALLEAHPLAALDYHEDLGEPPVYRILAQSADARVFTMMLKPKPEMAKAKDYDGKCFLHLAYQYNAPPEVLNIIKEAWPEAENEQDKFGRLPKEVAPRSSHRNFIPIQEGLLLQPTKSGLVDTDLYPKDAVIPCRGNLLLKDPTQEERQYLGRTYGKTLEVRLLLFQALLQEFSKMIGVADVDAIQRAAALETLAAPFLSHRSQTIVNLDSLQGQAYWYQQEVLKLVQRTYVQNYRGHYPKPSRSLIEGNGIVGELGDEAFDSYLQFHNNGGLKPSDQQAESFQALVEYLTEDLSPDTYSLAGPVRKSLQSLFNKLYIRRGQTKLKIIGDMTRATLFVDDKASLDAIRSRLQREFPDIMPGGKKAKGADKLGVIGFMEHVSTLQSVPDSTIIPYRFKPNSSQFPENASNPLWYNLNFFDEVPEYHRSGDSDLFVAFELQIGVKAEIDRLRSQHDAYERDRILDGQPILKNFLQTFGENKNGAGSETTTAADKTLIENILKGRFGETLLKKLDDVVIEHEATTDEMKLGITDPQRLCLNNKHLNGFVSGRWGWGAMRFLAGPFDLNPSNQYYVDSLVVNVSGNDQSFVGLCALVGPYMIEITALDTTEGPHQLIHNETNFSLFENVCPIPPGATSVAVIMYGDLDGQCNGSCQYDKMKLILKQFKVMELD